MLPSCDRATGRRRREADVPALRFRIAKHVISGNVVLLNGTSSSGKSTIARAFQENVGAPYLHSGIDHFLERLPPRLFVEPDGWGIQFDNRGLAQLPVLGAKALRILNGMYQALAAFAGSGNDVIIDDVIYDDRVLASAVVAFETVSVLFVGIRCPVDVAEARERDRADRAPGGARIFAEAVHRHGMYDIEIDSSVMTPDQASVAISEALDAGRGGETFEKLRRALTR
jgi:chloramphenicol 3-O phosphotransferase